MKMGSHCGPIFYWEQVSNITQNREREFIFTYKYGA